MVKKEKSWNKKKRSEPVFIYKIKICLCAVYVCGHVSFVISPFLCGEDAGFDTNFLFKRPFKIQQHSNPEFCRQLILIKTKLILEILILVIILKKECFADK